MTNNPTIDGVSRDLLERLLTDACNENWSDLNELLHSPDACRCRRFGKDNPHWPCPVHSAQGDQRDPTAAMTEAGCQAYMDADGMIGIMHNSSMGQAYVAMRELDPEVAALQSTIARLEARLAELESGRGEPVAWQYRVSAGPATGWSLWHDGKGDEFRNSYQVENRPLFTAPPARVAVGMSFEFEHPSSKEKRTVTLTKRDVFDGMEDYFYDKLGEQICQCESVGETNVVDCNCDEYVHDFEIVNACLYANAALNKSP